MKHGLLALLAVLALAVAAPASAQFIYIDADGDGDNDSNDILTPSTSYVDVYLDTNSRADGSDHVCPEDPNQPMNMSVYAFVLNAPSGGVAYGTYTDMTGFDVEGGTGNSGNDFWAGKGSSNPKAPGTHHLGRLNITVTGSPTLAIVVDSSAPQETNGTMFGTACPGAQLFNVVQLGVDPTFDARGTASPTPTTKTTWGKIKDLYR